jgi:hypothetical protein
MKLEEVYDESGERLGDEYVNISSLQFDTKKAIIQLIHLDELVDTYSDALNRNSSP